MSPVPVTGTDGPYAAPLPLPGGQVLSDWIDYNGHMNVAYYVLAFDQALDRLLEDHLGVGETRVRNARQGPYALQSSIHYRAEMLEGQAFSFDMLLINHDAKRMHVMLRMLDAQGGVAATLEQILMNVDLVTRRPAPYPDWAQARMAQLLADHAQAPRPPEFGQPLALRAKR